MFSTLVRWHDNAQVTMATNCQDDFILEKGTCKRWSRQKRAQVNVDQPTLVKYYNKGMGGVDLFDKQRALYRSKNGTGHWFASVSTGQWLICGSYIDVLNRKCICWNLSVRLY